MLIIYKKKAFEGTIKIIEKVAPTNQVDTIMLKSFTIKKGTALSTNPADYISEPNPLTDEVKALLKFDLSGVDITKPGQYHTANITVTEDQENNILSTDDNKTTDDKTTTTTPSDATTPTTPDNSTQTDTTQKS